MCVCVCFGKSCGAVIDSLMLTSCVLLCLCGTAAHTEVVTDDEDGLQHMGVPGAMHQDHKKRRGLRRFFGK